MNLSMASGGQTVASGLILVPGFEKVTLDGMDIFHDNVSLLEC